jgi:hypothetical protein
MSSSTLVGGDGGVQLALVRQRVAQVVVGGQRIRRAEGLGGGSYSPLRYRAAARQSGSLEQAAAVAGVAFQQRLVRLLIAALPQVVPEPGLRRRAA